MEKTVGTLTTLCYLEQDDKLLMMHRVKKKNDVNQDKWIGVGGHAEAYESPEDCLLRETFEETRSEADGLSFPRTCDLRPEGRRDPVHVPLHSHRLGRRTGL